MSTMPRENNRHSVLGNIRKLASFARDNFYPRQLRSISPLGNELRNLRRMERGYDTDYNSTPTSRGFSRFSNPNSGNIAQSGNVADADRITSTASAGRMASPSARDRDTIKKWRRV